MDHNLSQTIALLARTPATLNALLCDLPEAWTLQNEGENTWSAYDVVDHLVHVERGDWIPRIKIVLEFGETQTLEPVDRLAHSQETQRQNPATATGRIRPATLTKSRGIAGTELTTGRPQALWTTSSPRPYYSVGVGCHLGRSRSHSSTPSLKDPGPPIPRRCKSMEPIPGRPPMRRPQFRLTRSVLRAAPLRFFEGADFDVSRYFPTPSP